MTDKEIFDYLGKYHIKHRRTKNGLFIYGKTVNLFSSNQKYTYFTYISNQDKNINDIKLTLDIFIAEQKASEIYD